jgi:hypothetical protein
MLGEEGAAFYAFLQDLASYAAFKNTTSTLAETELYTKGDEELVLRFFAAKNFQDMFRGNIRDWLDNYMESILLKKIEFPLDDERRQFQELFDLVEEKFGETAFVKFRGTVPVGGLAPAYYEAVAIGSFQQRRALRDKDTNRVKQRLIDLVQTPEFRSVTGPGANNKTKLMRRIELVATCIAEA